MEINGLSGCQFRIETLLCKSVNKGDQVSQARFMFNTYLLSSLIILLRFPFVTKAHRRKSFKPSGFAGLSPYLTSHFIPLVFFKEVVVRQ